MAWGSPCRAVWPWVSSGLLWLVGPGTWFESSPVSGLRCSHSCSLQESLGSLPLAQSEHHTRMCGTTVDGHGGSWMDDPVSCSWVRQGVLQLDGLGFLPLALLEPIQSEQGLLSPHLWGLASCQPWDAAKLPSYPFKAAGTSCSEQGEKQNLPQQKLQRKGESWSHSCGSPEWEGGAGSELPAALSELLYKAASKLGERDTPRGLEVVTLANVLDGRKELFLLSPRYGVSVAVAFKPHYTGLSSKIKCY